MSTEAQYEAQTVLNQNQEAVYQVCQTVLMDWEALSPEYESQPESTQTTQIYENAEGQEVLHISRTSLGRLRADEPMET